MQIKCVFLYKLYTLCLSHGARQLCDVSLNTGHARNGTSWQPGRQFRDRGVCRHTAMRPSRDRGNSHAVFTGNANSRPTARAAGPFPIYHTPEGHADSVTSVCNGSGARGTVSSRTCGFTALLVRTKRCQAQRQAFRSGPGSQM